MSDRPFVTHAGDVRPDDPRWWIVESDDHATLKRGDLVRAVEDPEYNNWLVDKEYRLHKLHDSFGTYVPLMLHFPGSL